MRPTAKRVAMAAASLATAPAARLAIRRSPRSAGWAGRGRRVTMFSRLTRWADTATVASVMIMPRKYDTTMVRRANCGVRRNRSSSPKPAKIRFSMPTMSALTASPSSTPTAADTSAYAVPSKMNIWTRWRRLAPMALAMPISDMRAAASITKIRNMSSTPTITENRPMFRKSAVTRLPASSAASRRLRLNSITLYGSRSENRPEASS